MGYYLLTPEKQTPPASLLAAEASMRFCREVLGDIDAEIRIAVCTKSRTVRITSEGHSRTYTFDELMPQ